MVMKWGVCYGAAVMTETLLEVYSDAWWQRVGPALSADGRALVGKNLTQAEATLGNKEKEKFAEALGALNAPSDQQMAWLRNLPAVPESEELLDLSNILICHPDTGAPISFKKCPLPAVTFKGSVFVGNASFLWATFTGNATFEGATFTEEARFLCATFAEGADFWKTTFADEADFQLTTFTGWGRFVRATFTGEAGFWQTKFAGPAWFGKAVFVGVANFGQATFAGEANFEEAMFTGEAYFWKATFTSEANFEQATFADEAWFRQTTFTGPAYFRQAIFTGKATFEQTEFGGQVNFGWTDFRQVANFHAARFGKTVSFRGSEWGAVPDFIGTAWKDGVAVADFEQLQTGLITGTLDWRNPSTSDPDSDSAPAPITDSAPAPITDRLQALRKMARDADDRPRELDYFALELQARYQGKGLGALAKRCLVSLYRRLSDYGRGIGRPLWWLVGWWGLFALFYGVLADGGLSVWREALLLSLVNALPTLGAGSTARESSLEALYDCDVPSLVHGIAVIEGVIGLILLFLIALGLRNRFRL